MSVFFLLISAVISFVYFREKLLRQFRRGKIKQPLTIWAASALGGFVLLQVVWSLLDRLGR